MSWHTTSSLFFEFSLIFWTISFLTIASPLELVKLTLNEKYTKTTRRHLWIDDIFFLINLRCAREPVDSNWNHEMNEINFEWYLITYIFETKNHQLHIILWEHIKSLKWIQYFYKLFYDNFAYFLLLIDAFQRNGRFEDFGNFFRAFL